MHPAQIKATLEIAGYSLADLAREFEVTRASVSAVVNGRSRSAHVEARIVEITRIAPETLWPQWYGQKPLTLSAQERELVLAFRAASAAAQRRALRNLGAVTPDDDVGHHVRADRGSIAAGRDVTLHEPKPPRYRDK